MTVLTGFLGAGKTTLLSRILTGTHGLRVAALVNDFGSINIDQALIASSGATAISLTNGCVCCTIRDDLIVTVIEALARPERPEYLILEASGVSDPSGIATTLLAPLLSERIRVDSIICVVDADGIFNHPEHEELKIRQIAFSDLLLLNKVDLAGPEGVQRAREWIAGRMRRVRIVETRHCELPLDILLSVGRFDAGQLASNSRSSCPPHCSDPDHAGHGHGLGDDHTQAFSTWSYESHRPLSMERLEAAVRQLPETVYRVKGFVHAEEQPEREVILQAVGRRADMAPAGFWGEHKPATRIVVIGARGALDVAALRKLFDGCA